MSVGRRYRVCHTDAWGPRTPSLTESRRPSLAPARPARRSGTGIVGDVPDQPPQNPPPVQWLRVRYGKRGRARFSSHRDFGRAFERAVLRSRLPVAYSSGFNPHPRISYANASPTGAATQAEYLEIGLTDHLDPGDVRDALDTALPDGFDILDVVVAGPDALADRLEAAQWEIRLSGLAYPDVEAAAAAFMACDSVEVDRRTKRGVRRLDVRAATVTLDVRRGGPGDVDARISDPCAILEVVVRQGTPSVRPDDILVGLREVAGLEAPMPPLAMRLAQGPWDPLAGRVVDPLTADRDAGPHRAATAE